MKELLAELLWEWMVDYRQEMDEIDGVGDIERVMTPAFVYRWGTTFKRHFAVGPGVAKRLPPIPLERGDDGRARDR